MGSVPERPTGRKQNNDINPFRRSEIVRHARLIGAMATDDRDRWLIAWVWHNPEADDQVWSVMLAFQQMNQRLTELPIANLLPRFWTDARLSEAEAAAIVDEAASSGPIRNPDKLAEYLGLTYVQRTACRIKTIGSIDVKKRARTLMRKRKDKRYREAKRRANGTLSRLEYEAHSLAAQARAEGVSRMTIYRRRAAEQAKNPRDVTGVSAITLSLLTDRPVTVERVQVEFERGFASKEARGLSSSVGGMTLTAPSEMPWKQ